MAKQPSHLDQWAADMAEIFSVDVYREAGPSLQTDIDEIEDNAVLAATAVFDAVIARALKLQNQQQATRSLAAPRQPSPEAPANLPQVGVVEMNGRVTCQYF